MKRKIINDPVYGLMNLPDGLPFELMEHPYMQRLRRIKQTGLLHLVYPGSTHSRFHHALGVTHLMDKAIETLRMKGHNIINEEAEAAISAALLHDIGHGPFSHSLEYSIVNIYHEKISDCFFNDLNRQYNGKLEMAKSIFNDQYSKRFLHQLLSGQIDVDRMDYLKRDSFFTGVSEGIIAADRIINMFEIKNDRLVVEEKGLYSVENFLVARRMMYWQVYLHKTVVAADYMLMKTLQRAKQLCEVNIEIPASPAFLFFLKNKYSDDDLCNNPDILQRFSELDDFDVFAAIKQWCSHPDKILSYLSYCLVNRNIYAIEMRNEPFEEEEYTRICKKVKQHFNAPDNDLHYFVISETISNNMYNFTSDNILILKKNNTLVDIVDATDHMGLKQIAAPVVKYVLAYPKILRG